MNNGAIKVWRKLSDKINKEKDEEYLDRLSKIERIKEYRIPVEILHTDDYEEITEAFIRVNSKGTPLREAELALARLSFYLPGIYIEEFDKCLDENERIGFEFEARFLMRCYIAIATGQSRFRYLKGFWSETKEDDLKKFWGKTRQGLDSAINFLRNNIGIESSDWLPSINALVPLVYYFSNKKDLNDEEEKLLLFWFYSASMWGRYSTSPETKLDQDLKALQSFEIRTLIENCKRDVTDLKVDEEELIESYQGSAFLPIFFAIIRRKRAKDWFNGIELSATNVGPSYQIEMHHIFPRSLLKSEGYSVKEIDDLSNIAFLFQGPHRKIGKSEPIDYLEKFNVESTRLESQYVPINKELWKVKNYKQFLDERRKLITRAMNDYLHSLGGQKYM